MEGRGSASPGGERASRQIATWLGNAGLRPGGDHGTFFQTFTIATAKAIGEGNELVVLASPMQPFDTARDWRPHGGSLEQEVEGAITFVRYGLTAPEQRHDDYAAIDARGKIALALEGAPGDIPLREATRIEKLITARRHGAAALLIVSDRLPSVATTAAQVNIVSGTITRAAADRLLAASGRTIATLEHDLRETPAPQSFDVPARARLRVVLAREEQRTANVVGILPGRDPALASEAVVIGAHYDHLGRVNGTIHPGADDNASGTALVIGLARAFADAGGTSRTLVFALFSGEELGLLGSRHYVGQPASPLERTVAMVNFDMVGRMQGDRLTVGGVDTGLGLRQLVTDAARDAAVKLDLRGRPSGASDHARFYQSGAPVLFFFTGTHDDYHQPTDTADRINGDGMARVAAVASATIERLANGPRPAYAKVPVDGDRGAGHGGAGAFLGVMAKSSEIDGLVLADVVPGSAAARAGMHGGDVIVRFAGTPVNGIEDLRQILKKKRAGDRVDVVFLRNGEERTGTTSLDARP